METSGFHVLGYLRSETPEEALAIALSYLEGEAIGSKASIDSWTDLSEHLKRRFSPLNKQEISAIQAP